MLWSEVGRGKGLILLALEAGDSGAILWRGKRAKLLVLASRIIKESGTDPGNQL
jgi:hypothetical protein